MFGEEFKVSGDLLQCTECSSKFNDPQNPFNEIDMAHDKYRKKYGLLSQEDILQIRKKVKPEKLKNVGLTMDELKSYEMGLLHNKATDIVIRSLMEG